jgi:hypothetical protein
MRQGRQFIIFFKRLIARIQRMWKTQNVFSVLSDAVLVWNTHHIQQIVDEFRAEGLDIPSEHLQKISALMFKHIQIYGTYHFEDI